MARVLIINKRKEIWNAILRLILLPAFNCFDLTYEMLN